VAILIAQPRGVVCSVGAAFTQGTQTADTACSTGYCTTEPWSSCVLRRDVGDGGSGAVQRLCSDRGFAATGAVVQCALCGAGRGTRQWRMTSAEQGGEEGD
jgi:hypothetical protein